MYEKRLGDAGYISFKLARTNNRGDGRLPNLQVESFSIPFCASSNRTLVRFLNFKHFFEVAPQCVDRAFGPKYLRGPC